PYHHLLDDFLKIEYKARVRAAWLQVSGCDSLKELFEKANCDDGPQWLNELATEIADELMSTEAVEDLFGGSDEPQSIPIDATFRDTVLLTRDLDIYIQVDEAIRSGDVGRLEDLAAYLTVWFKGSGSNNYAQLFLDYLQWHRHEATAEYRDAVRDNCWLVNRTGKRNNFLPGDLFQEHNNAAIKYIHAPMAANATWALLGKISPAIPILTHSGKRLESQF
ncbi:hypothetical protein SISSUDRAFT_972404, partial [Sistotremastrum suecicum HHB10207 ss-3]